MEKPEEPDPDNLADLTDAFSIDIDAANATADRIAGMVVEDGKWRDALVDLLIETRSVPFVEAVAIAAAQAVIDYLIRAMPPGLQATMIMNRLNMLVNYAGTLKTRGARQVEELNARYRENCPSGRSHG